MTLLDELLSIPKDEVATWPLDQQQWYTHQVQRALALRSPADFAQQHSHGMWRPFNHLIVTSNAIVSMIEEDDCDLLLIDQPVRHGKSELSSKWTPAWFLMKYPTWPVLLASYEAHYAGTWGGKVRDIVVEVGSQYGVKVRPDAKARNAWELDTGGGMNTAGAGGSITGRGGLLNLVDDPIKNREEAMSAVERQKQKEWWDTTWVTRREAGHHWPDGRPVKTKYMLIMSRWHIDDLMGWLISRTDEMGLRLKRLRMPAIAEDDDMLGRRPGEPLCPELFDLDDLMSIRKDSPLGWPALYQQRPVPEGGGMLKQEWFKQYSRTTIDNQEYFRLGDRLVARDECALFATMDTAYTGTKRSDYTALAVWAVTPNSPSDLLLLWMYRVRVTHAEHAPLIRQAWTEYRPRWVGLEKISATHSLFAEASREGIVMRWLPPEKNKAARFETAVALTEQGRVWLPEQHWVADFIEECVTFPTAAHDDQVDVFAYAAGEVYRRTIHGHRRKQEATSYDDRIWEKLREQMQGSRRDPVLGKWPG